MKSGSILTTIWPLLKLLQIIGGCPIKKDDSNPCGFKALSFAAYCAILICVWLVVTLITLGIFCYLLYIQGLSGNQLMKSFNIIKEIIEKNI